MAVPAPSAASAGFSEADMLARRVQRDVVDARAERVSNGDTREALRLVKSARRRLAQLDECLSGLIHVL